MATQVQTGFNKNDVLRRVQGGETDLFYQLVSAPANVPCFGRRWASSTTKPMLKSVRRKRF